jgi:tripartite-type tricarboxylate transporter receptor subunit TctC
MRPILLLAALALSPVTGLAAAADAYPARPVRVIVPFPPGGSNDIVARLVSTHLTERLGRPFVVDNRGGAGGRIGYETSASAHPDGHTLLIISAAYAFMPAMYKLNFDASRAFVPVAMLGTGANALAVFPGVPAKSVKELVALAKANPGKVTFASSGQGGSPHLTAELFQLATGTKLTHVPYKAAGLR